MLPHAVRPFLKETVEQAFEYTHYKSGTKRQLLNSPCPMFLDMLLSLISTSTNNCNREKKKPPRRLQAAISGTGRHRKYPVLSKSTLMFCTIFN